MPESPELEARVAALETDVRQLTDRVRRSEQDAAAARVLAGGADRDVAEIRTEIREFRDQNNRVLNALRENMTDLRQEMDSRFDNVDSAFIEMRGRFDATAAGQRHIADMLTTLIVQQDEQPNDK